MKFLQSYDTYLNEDLQNVGMITKVFAKAATDGFSISILNDILKMTKGQLEDINTWIEPYKNIFRKACRKFGSGQKGSYDSTCDKDKTIKALYDHYLGENGIMDPASIKKYFDNMLKEPGEMEFPIEQIDQTVMTMANVLLRTGVSPATLKEVGTKVLTQAYPYLKLSYPQANMDSLKMFTDGSLIDPAAYSKLKTVQAPQEDANTGKITL